MTTTRPLADDDALLRLHHAQAHGQRMAALAYRLVAANGHRLPGGTPACALPPAERPGASPAA